MSNIRKGIYSFIFCALSVFAGNNSYGQKLLDTQNELDINGEVYSVKKFQAFGSYYGVCGDFTNFGGAVFGGNFALIDANDHTSETLEVINTIDGPIYDFALHIEYVPIPVAYLYIGGDFTVVNGTPRNGAARLSVALVIGNTLEDFAVDSWDPQFIYGTNEKVLDIEYRNDTVYYVGDFNSVNNFALLSDARPGVAAFDGTTGSDLPMFNPYAACNSQIANPWGSTTNRIALGKHHIIASGSLDYTTSGGSFFRYNYDGCIDDSYPPQGGYWTGVMWAGTGKDIEVALDTVYGGIFQNDLWFDTDTAYYPPLMIGQAITKDYQGPPPQPYTEDHSSIAAYKDKFYVVREVTGTALAIPRLIMIDSAGTTFPPFDSQTLTDYTDHEREHIFVADNICFASKNGTYGVGANTHTGLYALCLEPHDIDSFAAFDTTICQGEILQYQVSTAQFAMGYEWSFSGSGVILDTANFFVENSTVDAGESIWIEFLDNFVPGTLSVRPWTTCNDKTIGNQKVYAKPIEINIGLNPLPNAYAGIDTLINCYNDSVQLTGISDTAGVTYSWNQIVNPLFTDSIGQTYVAHDSDWYVLRVQAPNGCLNFDTVFVDMDTLTPTFDPVLPDVLGCNDTLYFLGHCNNGTDTLSWWEEEFVGDTLANPLECTQAGNYIFYTQFDSNGCIAAQSPTLNIIQILAPPNIEIAGYPSPGIPLDYLTCNDPILTLTAYSDSANTIVNWVDQDTLNPIGDTNPIDSVGTYLIQAYDTDNNCYNYLPIIIDTNITKPVIDIGSYSNLNCSNDSLILDGSTSAPDSVLIWTGGSISPTPNPVTIFDPGYYTLTVTRNDNGCSDLDSVLIVADNSIDVIVSNDTSVCDQDPAAVIASYVGTITGITYLWSNGENNPNATYTGGIDSLAIIEINGLGGCYGTDTIRIEIPPVPVVNFQGFAPCGAPGTGSIVATAVSGWAPFQYSINGGTSYEPSNVIDSLDAGIYTVTVRDTLGCLHNLTATIDASASPPTPNFLFSTFNFQSDTIALVDVSVLPPDSVNWIIPPEIILLDDNDTVPLITLPTLGTFDITMDAYFGTCLSSLTKSITITEQDTTVATLTNENGIDTIFVYPNPSDGNFTLEVYFHKEQQQVAVYITDMLGEVLQELNYNNIDQLQQDFVLPAVFVTGNYIIRVVGQYDSDYRIITINR